MWYDNDYGLTRAGRCDTQFPSPHEITSRANPLHTRSSPWRSDPSPSPKVEPDGSTDAAWRTQHEWWRRFRATVGAYTSLLALPLIVDRPCACAVAIREQSLAIDVNVYILSTKKTRCQLVKERPPVRQPRRAGFDPEALHSVGVELNDLVHMPFRIEHERSTEPMRLDATDRIGSDRLG